jgi:ubiquinone/menaquinone biosynthesis C-methylase UbiE
MGPAPSSGPGSVEPRRRDVTEAETQRANRGDWDRTADEYQAEHGSFLRDVGFIWCPEGLDESDVGLLGDLTGKRILEVGCGAGQCSRWLVDQGARSVGLDLSVRQLQHSRRIDESSGVALPVVCATASQVPFADDSFDLAFSAYGALPFVLDAGKVLREVARVLRDGGRFVFSVSHPIRWTLPDDPTSAGLTVTHSYFDRSPYVEQDETGAATYVEHHRTFGDWVRAIRSAGFDLDDVVEPEWPEGHDRTWGAWSRERGLLTPGTAIFCCSLR